MLERSFRVTAAVVIATALLAPNARADELIATISVDAGERERLDTPVSVSLPTTIEAWQPLRLVEVRGERTTSVPHQVEPGDPARLWFVLRGETEAGAAREFRLLRRASPDDSPAKGPVSLALGARTLDVRFGEQELFRYNHAHVVPPEGVEFKFVRSGYIDPMYGPSGELLTEDFPADHYHHKGIWMPWTKTEFEGHEVDFWNLGALQGTVQFAGFERFESGPVYGRFRVRHEHVDLQQPGGGKVVLEELWDVRVWTVGGPDEGYWLWDLTSEQTCVADSPLHLKAYRYGGLGWRGPKAWNGDDYQILSSEGKTRKDAHATRSSWCAHSGETDGERTTVVILCHSANERFPEPMRTWDNGMVFFNYVPPQKEDLDLLPGVKHVFRYRFFIHSGGIDEERARSAWSDFCEGPKASLRLATGE